MLKSIITVKSIKEKRSKNIDELLNKNIDTINEQIKEKLIYEEREYAIICIDKICTDQLIKMLEDAGYKVFKYYSGSFFFDDDESDEINNFNKISLLKISL